MSGCYDRLYRLNMSRFREELVINARSVFHPCFPNLSDDDTESLSKLVEDLIADGLYLLTYQPMQDPIEIFNLIIKLNENRETKINILLKVQLCVHSCFSPPIKLSIRLSSIDDNFISLETHHIIIPII